MSKVKSVTFGGDSNATVLLVPKRKGKKYILNFYSIKGKGIERKLGLINTTGIEKGKPMFKLKFRNIRGIESMLTILGVIRDKSLYEKGYLDAKKNNQLKGILTRLPNNKLVELTEFAVDEFERRFPFPEQVKQHKEKEQQPETVQQQD